MTDRIALVNMSDLFTGKYKALVNCSLYYFNLQALWMDDSTLRVLNARVREHHDIVCTVDARLLRLKEEVYVTYRTRSMEKVAGGIVCVGETTRADVPVDTRRITRFSSATGRVEEICCFFGFEECTTVSYAHQHILASDPKMNSLVIVRGPHYNRRTAVPIIVNDGDFCWMPDESHILCRTDTEISICRLSDGSIVRQWQTRHPATFLIDECSSSPLVSPDGNYVAVIEQVYESGRLLVWRLATDERIYVTTMWNMDNYCALAWSADSSRLALCEFRELRVWSVAVVLAQTSLRQVVSPQQHFTLASDKVCRRMHWSPDGTRIVIMTLGALHIVTLCKWTPKRTWMFPPASRRRVFYLMCVYARLCRSVLLRHYNTRRPRTQLPYLPMEMWFLIIEFLLPQIYF